MLEHSIGKKNIARCCRNGMVSKFDFANDNNISQRAICDTPEFKALMECTIRYASVLLRTMKMKSIFLGNCELAKVRQEKYELLMSAVAMCVAETAKFFFDKIGKCIAVFSVLHDAWDSKCQRHFWFDFGVLRSSATRILLHSAWLCQVPRQDLRGNGCAN